MTDRTTETMRRTMQAIVDVAPQAPDVATERPAPRGRGPSPLFVVAAAFAVVLLVGVAMAVVIGPPPGGDVASGPDPTTTVTTVPPTTWPPTTTGSSEVIYDTEAAVVWGDAVAEALESTEWDDPVIATYETHLAFTDGGTVTALVGETDWSRLVVDLQGWADGEYRTDETWQREVAGSNRPGRATSGGTLFVPADHANVVVLVSEHGLLTLQLVREEDETERLQALAGALAPAMESLASR